MASSAQSGGAGGGGTIASNPRVWIVAGIAVAGVIVLMEAARRRRRWLRGRAGAPPDFGAFCDRFELSPPPQPPPPATRHLLSGLTFAASDNFEIEGYVAGFGNPDWKRTHEAPKHTAVTVTMLQKQGATFVGRTVMDELGFGVTGENLHCGTPINPASSSLIPGGSCSGSAVAVAAQLVDFALGTDTVGDVRIPASFCGLLCFRPSYGVVSTLGTIENSQSLDTIGWFARDPCVLHRVGEVLLPATVGGLKKTRQFVFADDCFQLLSNQKTVHAIKNAVQTLPGYQPSKHINIGQYLYSNVPSLKEFCEPATKLQEGMSALKALSTVMLLLQRYEFKASHENWVNIVKPKLGLDISTRVLRAVNFAHDNIKSLYAIRNELRVALKNLLKDSGILVLPTTAGYPLKRNSKERLSSGFEDRMYKFVGIAALAGCCEVTMPLSNLDHHVSLSFVAAHGSDKSLLRTVLDTYSLIQEQVVLASKLVTTPVTNGDIDVDTDESELLKEKGNSAFKRRQWSKAAEFYSEAVSLCDTNATYYCNRAAAYLELGRLKQAEADCDRALLLDRKNVKAYLRRGFAREVTLNYKEALQDFRHALALEPQNKTALAAERRLQKLLK